MNCPLCKSKKVDTFESKGYSKDLNECRSCETVWVEVKGKALILSEKPAKVIDKIVEYTKFSSCDDEKYAEEFDVWFS